MLVFAIILVVSGALVIGALWGLYGYMPDWIQGNLLALAGGALMSSVVLEMIQPAIGESGLWTTVAFTVLGAVVFTGIDYLIDEKMQNKGGAGLLLLLRLMASQKT